MGTKLTVIVDNISSNDIKGEWGLSILAEYNDKKILIDTGASELFAENLKKLGFDINDIDYATLSHAHYDHSNGMVKFFKENDHSSFYLRQSADENCYFKKFFVKKYIGLPRNILSDFSDRIIFTEGKFEIIPGAYLLGHNSPNLDKIGKRENMYQRIGNRYIPDTFSHEQSLILDTDKGLVIINCCSHGGAVNIINEAKAAFPDKKVFGLIGGFHLFNKTEKEIREVGNMINETGIEFVCTGHCTKNRAFGILKDILGEKLLQLKVGLEMEFGDGVIGSK